MDHELEWYEEEFPERRSNEIRGRGTGENPPNRFERLAYEPEPEADASEDEAARPETQYLRDSSRSLLTRNTSPDIYYSVGLNAYRGCEHGCVYCYARPYHEYLGFSSGLDFETKILVKENAPDLLRQELSSPRWKPEIIGMSGVTDAYQPVERRLRITRGCLEVLRDFRNPVTIITKNHLVTREVDLLADLARFDAVSVHISITTLDPELTRVMEPQTSRPQKRLEAIRSLAEAGVFVGVNVAPVIPGLSDEEMPSILKAAAEAGARHAMYIPVRLPHGVADLFENWLEEKFPTKKQRVMKRVLSMRGGKRNSSEFFDRMRGEGVFAEQIQQMFEVNCRKVGLNRERPLLSTASFRRPGPTQEMLF